MTSSDYYLLQSEITRAAFDNSPDAIVVVDGSGIILAVNTQAVHLTGRARADLISQPVEILVPEQLRDNHRDHRSTYLRMPYRRLMGTNLEITINQRTDSGDTPIPVDVNLAPSEISAGTVVVATIRTRGGWGGGTSP